MPCLAQSLPTNSPSPIADPASIQALQTSNETQAVGKTKKNKPNKKNYKSNNEPVVLNFVNAELDNVIQIVSKLTGKNFLLDPKVKATISLSSLKPVSPKAVYPLFLAALRQQGLSAIELPGGVTKIILENDSRSQPVPILQNGQRATLGKSHLYTYIHPLEYESATPLIAALRPLMTANSAMSVLPNSNTIIVTDYAENIQKFQQIIKVLDRPAGEPKIFKLKHTTAYEMANTLNKLLTENNSAAGGIPADNVKVNIIPDIRTNSLLIRSDSLARKIQIQQWIDQLDVAMATPSNLHIVYLKNAEAARVATLLRGVLGIDNISSGTPETNQTTSLPAQPGGSNSATNTSSTPAAPKLSSNNGNNSSGNNSGLNVYADTLNNALIVLAPETVYRDIQRIIEQMDIRRAQVFVEALVVEMSADKASEFGIQWQSFGGLNDNQTRAIGGTNFGGVGTNILGVASNVTTVGQGLNIGVIKGSLTIPGTATTILNLGLLARALEANTEANILSTPTLMTLDNEEARIVVGQNVPFITGQYTQNTTGGAAPFQTIERRDVGLTLKVKPQITEGGSVRLAIYQEVSSVQDTTNAAGVITNKRSIESTILVNNGQTIVLGGLMQDKSGDGTNKVPIAGDIPILGSLFRYNTKNHNKTNLMIFMRPTIVRSAEDTTRLSIDRYRYLIDDTKSVLSKDSNIQLPEVPLKEGPLIQKSAPSSPPPSASPPPPASSHSPRSSSSFSNSESAIAPFALPQS